MKKIGEFFDKRATDKRFKKAGQGRTLGEASASAASKPPPSEPKHTASSGESQQSRRPRPETVDAAAAAALQRLDKREESTKGVPRTQALGRSAAHGSVGVDEELAALKLQQKMMKKARETREREAAAAAAIGGDRHPGAAAGAAHPAVDGEESSQGDEQRRVVKLYFELPDGTVVEEADAPTRLVQVLLSQLPTADDRMGAAAAIVHTACAGCDPTRLSLCVSTLTKFVANVKKDPAEPKYRKIRLSNDMVRQRVADVPGAVEFLLALGFERSEVDGEPHLILGDDEAVALALVADVATDTLANAKPVTPVFSHRPEVVHPRVAHMNVSLPPSFYAVGKDDAKRHAAALSSAREDAFALQTRELRDKNIRAKREYRFALVRVWFPSGQVLQATFRVTDTIGTIASVIASCLIEPCEFTLHGPGGRALTDYSQTVVDADLAPSAKLNIAFEGRGGGDSPALREDLPFAVAD